MYKMVCTNTFSPQIGEQKQIYFVHKLFSKNKKCSGIQNCDALKNAGFAPPPYYLKSTSTDTFDWDDPKIGNDIEKYYTKKEKKAKIKKRKPIKNEGITEETAEAKGIYAFDDVNAPKNVYMYKRKHLVQEITFPKRIKASVANFYRSRKKKVEDVRPDKKEEITNIQKKNKKKQNTCKCPENKSKKKKVEFAVLPTPEEDKKIKHGDLKLENASCKCNKTSTICKCRETSTVCKCHKKSTICKCRKTGTRCKCNKTGTICKCKTSEDAKKTISCVCKGDKSKKTKPCVCKEDEIDDFTQITKKQKRKHKKLKNKNNITSFYREYIKKVQIEDVPPEGYEYPDYLLDVHDDKTKVELVPDDKCHGGPCATAAKNKNYEFVCKCIEKKKQPHENECSNAICNVTSTSTVAKIRKKIIILCNKYSHILKEKKLIPDEVKEGDKQVCDIGLCRTAFDNKKDNFRCRCVKKATECTDTSCGLDPNWITCLKTYYKFFMKSHKGGDSDHSKRNAFDQTGEPFFEMKVDSIGLRALNPKEIRAKVEELGKSQQKIKCICPSHNRAKLNFLQKAVCSAGICEKTLIDKNTNFNCKCPNKKGRVCTDTTCEPDKKKIYKHSNKNPLLEVKFSAQDMSILNTDELRKSINDINTKLSDVCSAGICKEAAEENANYRCECTQKKLCPVIGECSEKICKNRSMWGDVRTRRKYNIHKRKGVSIPSIITNGNGDSNTFLKCKQLLSNSYSALIKRAESHRHKFKRNGLNIPLNANKAHLANKDCICGKRYKDCKCKHPTETGHQYFGSSLSSIKNKYRQIVKQHRTGVAIQLTKDAKQTKNIHSETSPKMIHKAGETIGTPTHKGKKVRDARCTCYHTCECEKILDKDKLKKEKMKKKFSSLSHSERLKHMKKKMKHKKKEGKSRTHDAIRRRKEFLKEHKLFQKEHKKKEKAEKKNKEKLQRIEQAELEAISKGREAEETSCFADFCLGILKMIVFVIKWTFTILFKIILDPKGSYTYVRLRLLDPVETFERMSKVISDAWRIKKLQMLKSVSGSDKMTILTDTLQDTALFQAFADKGKTPKEKRIIAQKNKQRKHRMAQRTSEAFRSCEHNLLHTLRKTPCLWVYHICPFFYPQCLGILALMRQLTDILLFMIAFVVWTPCIACCETCRAFCCCVLCTN